MLRIATPLILGTLGELRCKRAGVPDLGIERITVAGAFTGGLAVDQGGVPWSGVFAAAVAAATGAAFGLPHALLTVTLALLQHGAGLGITLLATRLARHACRVGFPRVDRPPTLLPFAAMDGLPIPVLNVPSPLTLLALVLVPAIARLLYRTPAGVALRRVGETAAAAAGSASCSSCSRSAMRCSCACSNRAAACSGSSCPASPA